MFCLLAEQERGRNQSFADTVDRMADGRKEVMVQGGRHP